MALIFPSNPSVNDTWPDGNGVNWLCTYASPDPIRWEKIIDVSSAAIVDSTINNSVIGDVTPANGHFVDVTASQDITVARNLTTDNLVFTGSVSGTVDFGTFDLPTAAQAQQRRSETVGQVPTFAGGVDDYGKLAINLADKILYVANSVGTAIKLATPSKVMSDTPPSNPNDGQEWVQTTTGINYTWYEDGDSGQRLADVAQDNGGGIGEAPIDGETYTRRDGVWMQSIVHTGIGSPEGVVTAPVGHVYTDLAGGVGTTLYIKEVGTDANGWTAK